MSDFVFMLVMFSSFISTTFAAYALAQWLRRRGHGDRLDTLHARTVAAQNHILRLIATFMSAGRANRHPPIESRASPDETAPKN